MKRNPLVVLIVVVGLCAGLLSLAHAGRRETRAGKIAYKKYCRSCHDGSTIKAKKLEPRTYMGKHWVSYFEKKLIRDHKNLTDPKHANKKVLDLLPEKKRKNILEYLRSHGADSDQPATCG